MKQGFVLLGIVLAGLGAAQVEDPPEGWVTFSALPNFWSGSRNNVNVRIDPLGYAGVRSYEIRIGGEFVDGRSFATPSVVCQSDIVFDSTHFTAGSSVGVQVNYVLRNFGGGDEAFSEQTATRTVFNRYAIHADTSIADAFLAAALAKGVLRLGNPPKHSEEAYVTNGTFNANDYRFGSDSIINGTIVFSAMHGASSGLLAPPGGQYVQASHVETAVTTGQPTSRPPLNLAVIVACDAFANETFGNSYLAGSQSVVGRAAVGFKVQVSAKDGVGFGSQLMVNLADGKPLKMAVKEAYTSTFDDPAWESSVAIYGDQAAKLYGAYDGNPDGSASTVWFAVAWES
ncbi:MAG: hypothetical protein KIS66_01970 [Fimbriimonadaceae bacterium]|nr:hypothetical protein [Fimbriimonadaceae bacterium]